MAYYLNFYRRGHGFKSCTRLNTNTLEATGRNGMNSTSIRLGSLQAAVPVYVTLVNRHPSRAVIHSPYIYKPKLVTPSQCGNLKTIAKHKIV